MDPGQHIAIVGTGEAPALEARRRGLELRDCLTVLIPGPTSLYVWLFRVGLSESTVAKQVLANGQGGIHIDACRIQAGDAPEGRIRHGGGTNTVYAQDEWTQRNQSKMGGPQPAGRWPTNVLLVHHPECRETDVVVVEQGDSRGLRRTQGKPESFYKQDGRHADSSWGGGFTGSGGEDGGARRVWDCHPTCPVSLLDGQTGELASGEGNWKRETSTGYQGSSYGKESRPVGTENVSYGDRGGASRFYPQFASLAEALDWLDRLLNV